MNKLDGDLVFDVLRADGGVNGGDILVLVASHRVGGRRAGLASPDGTPVTCPG